MRLPPIAAGLLIGAVAHANDRFRQANYQGHYPTLYWKNGQVSAPLRTSRTTAYYWVPPQYRRPGALRGLKLRGVTNDNGSGHFNPSDRVFGGDDGE
jgi:hypothetical protein